MKRLTCKLGLVPAVLALLCFSGPVMAEDTEHWVSTWGASPVAPVRGDPANPGFTAQTLRLIVHTSVGGSQVRVRLSNTFGTNPLVIGEAHIALRSTGANITPGTDRVLTFSGAQSVTIPPGALEVSDSVTLSVPALSDLAVSVYLPGPTGPATWHPLALCTNYIANQDVANAVQLPIARSVTSWFYLTDVEVSVPTQTSAIVTLGDSITDGGHSTADANHRWPNYLAQRLAAANLPVATLDQGNAGNALLQDIVGPNALARLDRDVLAQAGVKYVTVLLGTVDIGSAPATASMSAVNIVAGYQQIIWRAHAQGLKVFGCTLPPFGGSWLASPAHEAMRTAVNNFIRTSGLYDGVLDFDAAVRDPTQPMRLLPAYDGGDHLHPNDRGHQAMANVIDLSLFQ